MVRPARSPGRAGWAPLLVTALPFAVGLVAVALARDAGVVAGGDLALLELAVREAAAGQRLLGSYSRFEWHHPGPVYFYLLVAPYRLIGGVAGLQAGALLVNAAAALGTVAAVRRTGGLAGAWAATAVVVLGALTLGPRLLVDPWNPYVIVLPTLLFSCCARSQPRATR